MESAKLFGILLLLELVSVSISHHDSEEIDLTKKQIKYFKKNVKSWGAPGVLEVVGGRTKETRHGTELRLYYYGENDENCTAISKVIDKNGELENHEWFCRQRAESEPPLSKKFKEKAKKDKKKKDKDKKKRDKVKKKKDKDEKKKHEHDKKKHEHDKKKHEHDKKKHEHEKKKHEHEKKKHEHEKKKHEHEKKKHEDEKKKHEDEKTKDKKKKNEKESGDWKNYEDYD